MLMEAGQNHPFTIFAQANHHKLSTTPSNAFSTIQADLLAPHAVERLLEETQPDWVIHCAALANLEACEVDPKQA